MGTRPCRRDLGNGETAMKDLNRRAAVWRSWGVGGLLVFAAASALAQGPGCWPKTQADLKDCKAGCVKSSPTYDQCLSRCESMYRSCQEGPRDVGTGAPQQGQGKRR